LAPEASTPEWGGSEKKKQEVKEEGTAPEAGPKTWKGVGLYQARLPAEGSLLLKMNVILDRAV
jgi:hypothetical protein